MTNKKIIITRPKLQGLAFAKKLCQKNIDIDFAGFMFEPLIEVKQRKVDLPNLDAYDEVIVTSQHGRYALPKNYKCYDIGTCTPTARDLAEKIINDSLDKKLRFLYVRGADISFDMKSALENHGHEVDEIVSYDAVANHDLSSDFLTVLKNNEISAITFFSKRTAEIFIKSVYKYKIIDDLKDIKVLCISNSVLECLDSVFKNNIEISSSPDVFGMVEIVTNYCKRY